MTVQNVDPRSYVPQDTLFVWMLVEPAHPMLVGEVRLSQLDMNMAQLTAHIDRDALKQQRLAY